ncbi:hypothetical protein HYX15_02405 [Candidatus Woesearchaeota archaeon]|nr:hypothetical protein [Candidatus Woesearchaeota archaeon]
MSELNILKEKSIIPVDSYPYVKIFGDNPVLAEGLNLHDFYLISQFAWDFSRGDYKDIQIKHNDEEVDTVKKFSRLYLSQRRKLAELINHEIFMGGVKPLELMLIYEFSFSGLNLSGNLKVNSRKAHYPHVHFVWECGLDDYANQLGERKSIILNDDSSLDFHGGNLGKLVVSDKRNPLPMRNTLQFIHMHLPTGYMKVDDEMFNILGIPKNYLDHLREKFDKNTASYMLSMGFQGNGILTNQLLSLADRIHYNERFTNFFKNFEYYRKE